MLHRGCPSKWAHRGQPCAPAAVGRRRICTAATAPPATAPAPGPSAEEQAKLKAVRVAVFSAQQYVQDFCKAPLSAAFADPLFIQAQLDPITAELAHGCTAVVLFVNDVCTEQTAQRLAQAGVKLIALRCAGFDGIDLAACEKLGISVARVPTYSPQSVAEHAVALMFALNRKLPASYMRVSQGNYALSGLVGFQMYQKTVGVVGTGAIGTEAVRILRGIGCKVLAHDLYPNETVVKLGATYMPMEEMLPLCDIVTLHCPLMPSTTNLINRERIAMLKPGAMLINVSRGGLVESAALFDALESGAIGSLGLDVYDHEGDLFFQDFTIYDSASRMKSWDRQFKLLLTYPQVLVTPHSAFLTNEALSSIASTTVDNISNFVLGRDLGKNEVLRRK